MRRARERLSTAWRLLRRHARNAGGSPTRVAHLAKRLVQVGVTGEAWRILRRHELHGDLYADYESWTRAHDRLADEARAPAKQLAARDDAPLISVLMPVHDPDARWLRRAIESLQAQYYSRWQLCAIDDASTNKDVRSILDEYAGNDRRVSMRRLDANAGISVATNEALAMAHGTHIAFLDHDDELAPDALFLIARAFVEHSELRFVYTDEDRLDIDGRRYWPVFKPAWNPDLLLANNYITHLMAVDAQLARDLGGMRSAHDGAQDWDFALRATEQLPPAAIGHLPRVLYHWRSTPGSTAIDIANKGYAFDTQQRTVESALVRRGRGETVSRERHCWRVHPLALAKDVRVSIVIPSRDRMSMLKRCVDDLRRTTASIGPEIVIVDNGSTETDAVEYLAALVREPKVRIIRDPEPFNYPRLVNAGVNAANGDVVVLLNNDTHSFAPGWLEELCGEASRDGVGAVGALLLYADGSIQHAGMVLGVNETAEHVFRGFPADWSGINGRAQSIQDFSALTAACLAVRRELYLSMNGMDETYALSCNDVDFCLRLRERGCRVVFTPFASLVHEESATRGYGHSPEQQAILGAELKRLREDWKAWFDDDPAYNPNLARTGRAFALGTPVDIPECRPRIAR